MNTKNLHNEFVKALYQKIPKRADLVHTISDTLKIEKESVSRRLNCKVNFSISEMGVLAAALHMSIDSLLYKNEKHQIFSLLLGSYMDSNSMNDLCDTIDHNMKEISKIAKEPAEQGNVVNSLPIELFIHSPLLTKFMFFKWGYYFVGTNDFNNFSQWTLPPQLTVLRKKYETLPSFTSAFYIWDSSLIWTLAGEVENFHNMHIVNIEEKEAIKNELKIMLTELEAYLKGKSSIVMLQPGIDFYVSIISMGFTCHYFFSKVQCIVSFQTYFSYSYINNHRENAVKIKEWIKDLRNFSTLLSGSGSIERRLFFEKQHHILDNIL